MNFMFFIRRFRKSFSRCVVAIWSYRQLVHEIDWLRKTPYDSDNPIHENKLRSLWRALVPDQPLESRVSKQWGDIGFQGDDPSTDFRGMGLLGLENLLYVHFSLVSVFAFTFLKEPQVI